jgi:hypothetical protein
MTFTKSDGLTFLIGLGAALAVTLGEALIRFEDGGIDLETWAVALLTGLLAAAGRYLVTFLAQRGVSGDE